MNIIMICFVIILIGTAIALIAIRIKNDKSPTQPKMNDLLKGSYKEEINNIDNNE